MARIKWVSSSDAVTEVLYETREDLLWDVGDFGFRYFAKGDSFERADGVLAIWQDGFSGLFGEVKLAVGHLTQVTDNEGSKLGVAEVAGFWGSGVVFGDDTFFGDIFFVKNFLSEAVNFSNHFFASAFLFGVDGGESKLVVRRVVGGDVDLIVTGGAFAPFAAGGIGGFYFFAAMFAVKRYSHFVTSDQNLYVYTGPLRLRSEAGWKPVPHLCPYYIRPPRRL